VAADLRRRVFGWRRQRFCSGDGVLGGGGSGFAAAVGFCHRRRQGFCDGGGFCLVRRRQRFCDGGRFWRRRWWRSKIMIAVGLVVGGGGDRKSRRWWGFCRRRRKTKIVNLGDDCVNDVELDENFARSLI
jgi:hypothetical protein